MLAAMQNITLSNIAEYTVSELSSAIKRTMEDTFGLVRLRGEISGYRGPHSSGHAYLCLKDDRAKIDGVIWKGTLSGLKFKPEEGLEVIVMGRITTFPGKSSYQIIIEQLEPAGAGALMALLEERKKRLGAEGLFSDERKRPLPFWPQTVGIITSPTGAVIRDMLHGFRERCPVHAMLWPVRVQGETCGAEVAAAIRGFNGLGVGGAVPRPCVIIVARGGGSLEDLWGFNDESVVRAAADSQIPIISAVGHETDWTLLDLVADARAPTPTKAAEWAVPKHADLGLRLMDVGEQARRCIRRYLEKTGMQFRGVERGLPRASALVAEPRQKLDLAGLRLGTSLRTFSGKARSRLDRMGGRLGLHLLTHRTQRSRERLIALMRQADDGYHRLLQAKCRTCEASSSRLTPLLLKAPAVLKRERLTAMATRAARSYTTAIDTKRASLISSGQLLKSLSHRSILERGFAIVRNEAGITQRRAADLHEMTAALEIEFADGKVSAQYCGSTTDASLSRSDKSQSPFKRRLANKGDDGSQGSLL